MAVWSQQPAHVIGSVRASYFLLDENTGVHRFMTARLTPLLAQLRRRVQWDQVEYDGMVRGRILWPATVRARNRRGQDPARFVCRRTCNQFDTPENQLLRYVLRQVSEAIRAIPPPVRYGGWYSASLTDGTRSIAGRLQEIEVNLFAAQHHVQLRSVSVPVYVDERWSAAARRSRSTVYAELVDLYRAYVHLVQSAALAPLVRVARRGLALPASAEAAGEPWLRFAAAVLRGEFSEAVP